MKATVKTFFSDLLNSFNNVKNVGFSGRKLTAFTFVACIVYIHYIWGIYNAFTVEILICDIVGAAFFLGLISFTQILELKNGAKSPEPEQTPEQGNN
jgi:hypothetical protein